METETQIHEQLVTTILYMDSDSVLIIFCFVIVLHLLPLLISCSVGSWL